MTLCREAHYTLQRGELALGGQLLDEDDIKLHRQALEGSVEAFSRIVRLHQGRVRAYISGFVRKPDVIDDLAQDVFFAAYRSLASYNGNSALSTWLLGIARHRAINHLRKEASRQAQESGELRAVLCEWRAEAAEAQSEPESGGRELSALDDCIKTLPENSSRILARFYYENWTSKKIAEELGKSESSIRMSLLRIRQQLRACVDRRLQFPPLPGTVARPAAAGSGGAAGSAGSAGSAGAAGSESGAGASGGSAAY